MSSDFAIVFFILLAMSTVVVWRGYLLERRIPRRKGAVVYGLDPRLEALARSLGIPGTARRWTLDVPYDDFPTVTVEFFPTKENLEEYGKCEAETYFLTRREPR